MTARIAFFLPAITPWWFDTIVAPLIRMTARDGDVHVIVPPMWRGTGITADQLRPFADISGIEWHILDHEEHPALRTSTAHDGVLLSLIASIDPDILLCRSADPTLPSLFACDVRYIMEGAAPPIAMPSHWITLTRALFHHGYHPALTSQDAGLLVDEAKPVLADLATQGEATGWFDWRETMGIAPDRRIVALPLEYAHEENVFAVHRHRADNADWIRHAAQMLEPDIVIAATNHPLNALHADNGAVEAAVADLPGRVVLVPSLIEGLGATEMIAPDCAGAIIDFTKSWSLFAQHGVPIFRPAALPTASWIGATRDLDAFHRAMRSAGSGPARAPFERWLAFHIANDVIDPQSPTLTTALLIDHVRQEKDSGRWEDGIARLRAFQMGMDPC